MQRPIPNRSKLACALLVGTLSVPLVAEASHAAPRRIKAGDACTVVQTGNTVGNPPLECYPIKLRSNGRSVWKWLPVDPVLRRPSDATIRRYGGVVPATPAPGAATTTTTRAAVTTTVAVGSSATGRACLEGRWTADFEALNAYVQRASGAPGPFFASGSHTYEFRNGVLTGSGVVTVTPDPTGLITGQATAVNRATYTATDTEVTFQGASTLIVLDIRVAGQPIDIPFSAGGTSTSAYQCSGATLGITTVMPNGTADTLPLKRS